VNDELAVYRWLVVCRELDRALCEANPRWFPIEGEEATVVGSFIDLEPGDAAAPHYRDPFVVYLLRGAEMWRLAGRYWARPPATTAAARFPSTGRSKRALCPGWPVISAPP
jgi:TPP-dependent pyruvate/acetoin dehydrogenase alpha subunit